MNKNKFLLLLLGLVLVFSGCIPSQYTKGVTAEEYPDKDLPIYDDAIIFDYEGDEEEVTIQYGTKDDVEDVMDFYQEYFEDEDIMLDNEEEDEEEYIAEGFFENFLFEISAEPAKGDIEKKVFSTVVEVKIEFLSDEEIEERLGPDLQKDIIGFWEIVSAAYEGQEQDLSGFGFAMEFFADGTVDLYVFYSSAGMTGNEWSMTEDGSLEYYDPTLLDTINATVAIEKKGNDEFLYITEDDGSYTLKKTDKNAFMEDADAFGTEDMTEEAAEEDTTVEVPALDESILLDQNGIVVTMKGFEETYFSLDLNLLIENTTDKEVDVDIVYAVVNGYSMQDAYMIGTVAGNAKLNTEISFDLEELARCNIDEITEIQLVFELYDYAVWETIAISDVINVYTESSFMQTYDTSGITMVDQNGIKIVYQEFVKDDEYYGPYAVFYVENNTDKPVNFDCSNIQVNGFMISGFFYGRVEPGTCAIMTLEFYTSELEENDISEIENVKLSFEVYYSDDWSYFIETELMDLPIN